MKKEAKKTVWKMLRWIWISVGIILFLWTGYFYYMMNAMNSLKVIVMAVLFGQAIVLLIIYSVITLLFFIIRYFRKNKK